MHKPVAQLFAGVIAGLMAFSAARAENWPTRPIGAIVPLSAGSAIDVIPRIVFEQLSKQIGQPIVVENRPGASGTIGARVAALAYYDPIKDFTPVAALGNLLNVLVVAPSKNIKTIHDLVALGKKRPITFRSIGVGSPIQLAMECLRLSAGFKVQAVPYRGVPEALVETMAGRIDTYYSPILPALPLIRAHKLVPMGVRNPERAPTLPDVPTSEEAGYLNSASRFWIGIFVPSKTPSTIVDKLSSEIEKALPAPAVRQKLVKLRVQPMSMSRAQFGKFVKHEPSMRS